MKARKEIYFVLDGRMPFSEFLKGHARNIFGKEKFYQNVSKRTGIPARSLMAYASPTNKGLPPHVPPHDRFKKIIELLGYDENDFEVVNPEAVYRHEHDKERLAREAAEKYMKTGAKNFSTTFFRSVSQEHERFYSHVIRNNFSEFVEYVRGIGYDVKYHPQKQRRGATKLWSEEEESIVAGSLKKPGKSRMSREFVDSLMSQLSKSGYKRSVCSVLSKITEMRKYKRPYRFDRQYTGQIHKKRAYGDAADMPADMPADMHEGGLERRMRSYFEERAESLRKKIDSDYKKAIESDSRPAVEAVFDLLERATEYYLKARKVHEE